MRDDLPAGTVTFLFTDVEGSTQLLHELGAEGYAEALAEHRRVIREACAAHGGVEVDTQGDAFFFAFSTAPGALAAASAFTEALVSGPISVRVGVHTGTPLLTDEGYVGGDVHRAARIAACGHGGQVLVSQSTAALVEPSDTVSQGHSLLDLGDHRLKDLSAPERIYQLGDGDFPTLKSLYRTNLPVPATPFLGRERELSEVVDLLAADDARLLTLTGPGGTGKTRLALQAAGLASDAYPDGVFWVPLAPLRDPALVLPTAAETVGARNGLAGHIADKQMLCLFDNFEQVVGAAPELAELISACPNLDVLVTSRERLRVAGEQTYPVPPLAESDGEALFLTRARAIDPAFAPSEAVRELCLRLDELPLAIELAAARTALFSPEQLLARLSQRLDLLKGERDADPRQQTLRATIEWSYDLLSGDEQHLFRRLAVFSGGCSYEAAEEITGADPDTLQSLLDKSLVRKRDSPVGSRYWMLETIREYAAEKLEESGEADEIRQRHADSFVNLAEEVEPHLRGSPKPWLDRLEVEHDNVRTTLDYLDRESEGEQAQRLAGAMWRFWVIRGHAAEGRRRLEDALATDDRPTRARARALLGAAATASATGDFATARTRADQAIALSRDLRDPWLTAVSIGQLGIVHANERDHERALELFEEVGRRFSELGDEHYVLLNLRLAAWMQFELGDVTRARLLHERVVERARAAGNQRMQATSLGALGEYAIREERVEEALQLLEEGYRIDRGLGERPEILVALWRFAAALTLAGRVTDAARIFSAAEREREDMGIPPAAWMEEMNADTLSKIHAQLDDAAFEKAWEDGRTLTPDEAVTLALEAYSPEDGSVSEELEKDFT